MQITGQVLAIHRIRKIGSNRAQGKLRCISDLFSLSCLMQSPYVPFGAQDFHSNNDASNNASNQKEQKT